MAKKIIKTENSADKIIIAPWITEAASLAMEKNKYIFKVAVGATKREIEKAVEKSFSVKALSVRTINVLGKKKTRGKIIGKRADFKKAIVTLKEGDSINIYEGK